MDTAPKVLPPPPMSASEMTLESLMRGVPVAELTKRYKLPSTVVRVKQRGPGYRHNAQGIGAEEVWYFGIKSQAQDMFFYRFLTYANWRGLFVPKELVDPDVMLHDVYRDWALVLRPDQISSEYRVRTKAKEIVLEREGFGVGYAAERGRWQGFTIDSPATQRPYLFYTTLEWRGLKAPRRVVPGTQRGYVGVRYVDVYAESEIEGRKNVRAAARELVMNYEAIQSCPKTPHEGIKPVLTLRGEHLSKWQEVQAFLAYCDLPNGPSAIARWLLDQAAKDIPPPEEWEKAKKAIRRKPPAKVL